MRTPAELIYAHASVTPSVSDGPCQYVKSLQRRMLKAHEVARDHLQSAMTRQKEVYDARMSFHKYNAGDVVWCLHETRKVGVNPKLEKTYDGPFLIKEKRSEKWMIQARNHPRHLKLGRRNLRLPP